MNSTSSSSPLEVFHFKTQAEWGKWLASHYQQIDGIWLKFAKKNSGAVSVSYEEALDIALCYGWIDSQVGRFDKAYYIQKFTPRRAKSMWSKVNTEKCEKLIQSGKMKQSGRQEIEAAKADGRWEAAYNSPSSMTTPADFLLELTKNKEAQKFYQTLNKANIYAISWRLQTAKKPETRAKRILTIIEMLSRGEKFH